MNPNNQIRFDDVFENSILAFANNSARTPHILDVSPERLGNLKLNQVVKFDIKNAGGKNATKAIVRGYDNALNILYFHLENDIGISYWDDIKNEKDLRARNFEITNATETPEKMCNDPLKDLRLSYQHQHFVMERLENMTKNLSYQVGDEFYALSASWMKKWLASRLGFSNEAIGPIDNTSIAKSVGMSEDFSFHTRLLWNDPEKSVDIEFVRPVIWNFLIRCHATTGAVPIIRKVVHTPHGKMIQKDPKIFALCYRGKTKYAEFFDCSKIATIMETAHQLFHIPENVVLEVYDFWGGGNTKTKSLPAQEFVGNCNLVDQNPIGIFDSGSKPPFDSVVLDIKQQIFSAKFEEQVNQFETSFKTPKNNLARIIQTLKNEIEQEQNTGEKNHQSTLLLLKESCTMIKNLEKMLQDSKMETAKALQECNEMKRAFEKIRTLSLDTQ